MIEYNYNPGREALLNIGYGICGSGFDEFLSYGGASSASMVVTQILKSVTLDIYEGDLTVIMGASGAGTSQTPHTHIDIYA